MSYSFASSCAALASRGAGNQWELLPPCSASKDGVSPGSAPEEGTLSGSLEATACLPTELSSCVTLERHSENNVVHEARSTPGQEYSRPEVHYVIPAAHRTIPSSSEPAGSIALGKVGPADHVAPSPSDKQQEAKVPAMAIGPLVLCGDMSVGRQMRRAAREGLLREAPGESRVYFDAAVPADFEYRVRPPRIYKPSISI